ncbi:hypothetical protein AC442_07265 [Proteus mirabilis]|nr:hypothetical protein AOUC001_04150 [Proteus mirabilis]KAB7730728.1 hypothetical protein GBN10_01040 [Proteus mirabilis]KSA06760.1 hypothetical protein AC442_07265 [Proteus mirabilis]
MLGSIWFKHYANTRKRKAPENIQYINRGGLKNTQFDSASIFIGTQEEMKKSTFILANILVRNKLKGIGIKLPIINIKS